MRAPTQDVRLVVIGYGIASRERSSNCLYRPRIHKARGRRRLRATADGGKGGVNCRVTAAILTHYSILADKWVARSRYSRGRVWQAAQ